MGDFMRRILLCILLPPLILFAMIYYLWLLLNDDGQGVDEYPN